MTPKEKAQELVNKYFNASFNCKDCDIPYCDMKCTILSIREAKQCALIAVDEIIKSIVPKDNDEIYAFELCGNQFYWEEVKKEIEAL